MRTNMTYQGFKILIVKFVTWIKVFFSNYTLYLNIYLNIKKSI